MLAHVETAKRVRRSFQHVYEEPVGVGRSSRPSNDLGIVPMRAGKKASAYVVRGRCTEVPLPPPVLFILSKLPSDATPVLSVNNALRKSGKNARICDVSNQLPPKETKFRYSSRLQLRAGRCMPPREKGNVNNRIPKPSTNRGAKKKLTRRQTNKDGLH